MNNKINSIYEVLDQSIIDKIKKMMGQKVTDLIDATNEEIASFDKWFDSFMLNSNNVDGSSFIDIYMSNTIPVKNMEIDMHTPVGTAKGTIHIGEEVILFRDNKDYEHVWDFSFDDVDYIATVPYSEMVSYLSQDEKYFAILGTVTFEDEKYSRITYPLAMLSSPNKMRIIEYGIEFKTFNRNLLGSTNQGDIDGLITEYLLMTVKETTGNFIQIFSEINLALLNPYFEAVIMESSTKIPTNDNATSKKKNTNTHNKRVKIRYVRKLRIGDIEEKCQKRGITRHAQIWYVTGHWRQYKSGKRIFIQGYWKGALRETKNCEAREREMMYALPDDEE